MGGRETLGFSTSALISGRCAVGFGGGGVTSSRTSGGSRNVGPLISVLGSWIRSLPGLADAFGSASGMCSSLGSNSGVRIRGGDAVTSDLGALICKSANVGFIIDLGLYGATFGLRILGASRWNFASLGATVFALAFGDSCI